MHISHIVLAEPGQCISKFSNEVASFAAIAKDVFYAEFNGRMTTVRPGETSEAICSRIFPGN